MNKRFILLLILVTTASCPIFVKPTYSLVGKPSVPEFTLKLVAHPYDVPPTYSIDPYTGKNVIDKEGYHVENKSIVITIRNQPLPASFNGTYYLFYNVRVKGHFEEDWKEIYGKWIDSPNTFPCKSNSEYTVLSISADDYPYGAQVDLQLEAIIGHYSRINIPDHWLFPDAGGHYEDAIAADSTSGWSKSQTATIIAPLSPLLSIILIVLLGVASLGLAFYLIKRKRSS